MVNSYNLKYILDENVISNLWNFWTCQIGEKNYWLRKKNNIRYKVIKTCKKHIVKQTITFYIMSMCYYVIKDLWTGREKSQSRQKFGFESPDRPAPIQRTAIFGALSGNSCKQKRCRSTLHWSRCQRSSCHTIGWLNPWKRGQRHCHSYKLIDGKYGTVTKEGIFNTRVK